MREGSTKHCEELPQKFLLVALRSGIGRISLDTPEMFDVVLPIDGVHGAVVVDYHYNRSQLFYADVNIDAIRRVNMKDTTDSKIIVSTGLNTPNGIAVDWLANNLYWTDTAMKKIEVSRLDGTSRKVILTENLDDPRAIILYPKRGFIFWADWGQLPKIERAYMDGSSRKIIIDSELGFPTGLAVDFEARRLYWADALQDRIEMCDFSGRKRAQVVPHATHPFGFTITPTHIYWTDWYNKSVLRAPKKLNPEAEEVRFGLRGALEIRSVSSDRQPKFNNPCAEDNGGCSHLCLFIETDYVCACPDVSDGRPCTTARSFNVPVAINDERMSEKNEEKAVATASNTVAKNSNDHAQFVIIATAISGGILIVVVIAIIGE
jgi:DNA-binding beta-propeller fold protein YncE